MEAISAAFKSAAPESQYEPVTPIPKDEMYSYPKDEMYSYAIISRSEPYHQAQKRKRLRSLYEGPEAPQAHVSSKSQPIAKSKSQLYLGHSHQAKSRHPRPLPLIIDHEDIVPLHSVPARAETVSHDEEPIYDDVADSTADDDEEPIIYDDIADSTAGDDEEPIYDDIADSTTGMEEYDTASGTQGGQSMKHRRELRGKIYEAC